MWNLKYDTNEFICEREADSDIENRLVVLVYICVFSPKVLRTLFGGKSLTTCSYEHQCTSQPLPLKTQMWSA